jgi:phosphatidyl-myo-inositol dimannoside synthase
MLNNEFPPLGGGTGTVNQALLQCFARVPGLEIDLITSALGKSAQEETLTDNIRIFKVPVRNKNIHHSSNRELIAYFIRGSFLALKLYRKRCYDLCFAWSAVPAGAIALLLWRLFRLHYLVRVCGPDIPGFERRYRTIYAVLCPLIRAIWRGADRVVAKSDVELEMIRMLDDNANVSLIYNGVDLSTFKPGDAVPHSGPLRLLCVGRLIERKGQHHLIDAVKRLTDEGIDVTLDLVGTGDAKLANKTQVDKLGLKDRVRFLGYVPREEMACHYAAAHVFVLPSYNEGMSVALLEAMAAGLPVVVTRTGGTKELVDAGVNGLIFDWADGDTLTQQLRCLATNRNLARKMGIASRTIAARFSWGTAAASYIEIFGKLRGTEPVQKQSVTSWES